MLKFNIMNRISTPTYIVFIAFIRAFNNTCHRKCKPKSRTDVSAHKVIFKKNVNFGEDDHKVHWNVCRFQSVVRVYNVSWCLAFFVVEIITTRADIIYFTRKRSYNKPQYYDIFTNAHTQYIWILNSQNIASKANNFFLSFRL